MSSELQPVLRRLPKLSDEELEQVRVRVQGLLSIRTGRTTVKPNEVGWLLTGVATELKRRGLFTSRLTTFNKIVSGCAAAAAEVEAHLLTAVGHELKLPEKMALGRVAVRALADYLEGHVTIGPKVLLQNLSKIPEAVDCAYPDYQAAGMLGWVIQTRRNG